MRPSKQKKKNVPLCFALRLCCDVAEPWVNNVHDNALDLLHRTSNPCLICLVGNNGSINRSRWINDTSMNCNGRLVRSRVLCVVVEGGLPAQVNEVVWECGLGPDYSMCGACFSLGGICTPMTTGETIFASGCIYTCWYVYGNTVCHTGLRTMLDEAVSNVGICAFTTIYIPMFACKPIPTCVQGVFTLILGLSSVCV